MGEAVLWDVATGTIAPLDLLPGRPLGGVRFSSHHEEYPGLPLAGALRKAGSRQLPARYPIALTPDLVERFAQGLEATYKQHRGIDPFWVTVTGRSRAGDRLAVVLVTKEQALASSDLLAETELLEVILPNRQIVTTTAPTRGSMWLGRSATLELQRIRYERTSEASVTDGERLFQAIPSGDFARRLSSSHSFRCLLAPMHKGRFTGRFASVRNPVLEQLYPGTDLAMAVLVSFSDDVAPHAVVIDETVATGIGLRPGEIVEVSPLPKFSTQFAERALSFRHALCRVHGSNTTDMEKPLVRLPAEVFDIIGVSSGSRIVIESFGVDSLGEVGRRRIVVRALLWRGEDWPAPKPGVPDIMMETGSQDLPPVTLDLAAQQELSAPRSSVVYVRPAIGSLIMDEWSTAATAVVIAALGAVVLGSVVVSALFIGLFLTLLTLQLWRRLR